MKKLSTIVLGLLLCTSISAENELLVGHINLFPSVDQAGSASMTIPIEVPTGTNGMQPNLALVYNSHSRYGLAGWGWNLVGISSIQRTGKTYYHDDKIENITFTKHDNLLLDGERLLLKSGENLTAGAIYQTEKESFRRITMSTTEANTFLVTDKKGVTSRYTSAGYIHNNSPLNWIIRETEDTHGNYMTYSYYNFNTNTPHISRIEYTLKDDEEGLQSIDPQYSIYFYYRNSPYKLHSYIGNVTIAQDRLLSEIVVFSGNETICTYKLEYNTSDIIPKLTTITKIAGNGDYYSPTTIVWSSADTGELINVPLTVNRKSDYIFGDFNGDGKRDYFSFDSTSTNAIIYFNSTENEELRFTLKTYTLPYKFVRLKPGDYNDDGRTDLIGIYEYNSEYRLTYLLSNGSSFTSTNAYSLCPNLVYAVGDFDGDGADEFINQDNNMLYAYGKSAISYPEVYLWYDYYNDGFREKESDNIPIDFNGNGKTDILCIIPNSTNYSIMEYNTDTRQFEVLIRTAFSSNFKERYLHFGDFNNDGKTDFIYANPLTTSAGFNAAISLSDGESFIYDRTIWVYDYRLKVQDFNGDGLSDIAYFYPDTNERWCLRTEMNTGGSFVRYERGIVNLVSEDLNDNGHIVFEDMYGLGFPNLLYMGDNSSVSVKEIYDDNPMLVNHVIDGMGNTYNFTYRSITNRDVYANTNVGINHVRPLVQPFYVVSDYTAPYTSLSYYYKNGRYHTQGKGFLGFEEVTTTDNLKQIKRKDIGNIFTPHLHYYPYSSMTSSLEGDTISYLKYHYTVHELGGKCIFPYISGYEYTDNLTGIKETGVFNYDNNGNLSDETISRGDWKEISQYQYVNIGSWCPNKVNNSLTYNVYNGGTSPYRRTFYKYDSRGNIIRQTIDTLYTDSYRLVNQYEYDTYGNVTKEIVSGSGQTRTRTYTYSADGRFMLIATDELGQTVTNTYDPKWGALLTQTTDAGVTRNSYDSFGHLCRVEYPDSVVFTTSSQFISNVPGVRYMISETRTNTAPVSTYYNASGKPLFTEKAGHNNRKIYTAFTYYPNGAERMVSEPYFSTNASTAASQAFTSDNATFYTYDEFQRPYRIESPEGITAYTYDGLNTTICTPTINKSIRLNTSGFTEYKQIAPAMLPLAGGSFVSVFKKVSYSYYSTGLVKTATPDGGSAVTMEYDVQGNRTKLIDPDAGTITNTYNAFGQVLTRSQKIHGSSPVVTTFEYGANDGRLLKETIVGKTSSATTYTYDYLFKDKPYRINGNERYSSYTYDVHGNIQNYIRSYGSNNGCMSSHYDKGLLVRNYMPNNGNANIYYTYDSYGNMTSEKYNSTIAWELLEQNARGQVVRERKGGIVTTYTYDNCGRVTSIVAPNILSLHYTYDDSGNVLTKSDAINNQSIEYSYDHLMRLVSWTVNNNSTQSITYDASTGNITSKTDLGPSSEFIYNSSSKPHALRGVNGVTGSWGSTDISISYTDFGKVESIQRGYNNYSINYGVEKERIRTQEVISGVSTTRYYMPNYELIVNTLGHETYITYLCNGSIAVYDKAAGTKTLYHGYYDAQGSLIALTDNSGNVLARYAYDPWGGRVSPTNWAQSANAPTTLKLKRGYTMHEHLDEFELINMNGRVYDPAVAQFLSPDPYIQDAGNWLNYNRYAYCYNNPTRYVDPSGEALWEIAYTCITDFFSTLFNGGLSSDRNIRQNAWRKFDPTAPWSKTNKSLQISRGLIKTDANRSFWGRAWQLISRFTWEGYQTFFGYEAAIARNIFGDVDRVDYYGGATFITNEEGKKEWGFSLGSFINTSIKGTIDKPFNEYIMKDNPMYMHEYGHYIQSQQTGPLYVVPAAASFLGTKWLYYGEAEYVQKGWVPRVSFMWPEVWANRMAKNYFGLYEEVDWKSIQWEYPIEYGLYKKLKYKWY